MVGLARDARLQSLGQPAGPHVFRAFAQDSGGIQNIIVATVPAGGAPLEMIRKTVTQRNTAARIYGVRPLAEWVDRSFWQVRWEASMLAVFGVLALILAAVGLYGVVACHVTGRTREIGIRVAVGAKPANVLFMILRQGLQLTLIGLAIGLAAAVVLTRAMTRLLFDVSATDLTAYASVTALWLIVAAAACYFPARRAAKVDPTVALRYD